MSERLRYATHFSLTSINTICYKYVLFITKSMIFFSKNIPKDNNISLLTYSYFLIIKLNRPTLLHSKQKDHHNWKQNGFLTIAPMNYLALGAIFIHLQRKTFVIPFSFVFLSVTYFCWSFAFEECRPHEREHFKMSYGRRGYPCRDTVQLSIRIIGFLGMR